MQNCHTVAMFLCKGIEKTGFFTIISARDPTPGLPLCTFSLKVQRRLRSSRRSPLTVHRKTNRCTHPLKELRRLTVCASTLLCIFFSAF